MTVKLPAFEKSFCMILSVRGKLDEENGKAILRNRSKRPLIFSYKTEKDRVYLRIITGFREWRCLHIDCALKEYFPKKFIPKSNGRRADLNNIIQRIEGSPINSNIRAEFKIPLRKLPEDGLIHSILARHKTRGPVIQFSGATCRIEGTPVRNLEWKLADDGKNVFIKIESNKKEKIDDSYLIRSFVWIEKLFNIFVLGKTADDRT